MKQYLSVLSKTSESLLRSVRFPLNKFQTTVDYDALNRQQEDY